MIQKLKHYFTLELFSAAGTWAIVAISSIYFMLSSARYETSIVLIVVTLHIVFISLWLSCTSELAIQHSKQSKCILLFIQFVCVMGLFFLVPFTYSAILITLWCTLLPKVVSVRSAMFSAPIWSSPLWLIYQFHWQEQYAFVSAALFFMFNIFALFIINTANKERQAQ